MSFLEKLSHEQLDLLKEIGNIGSGHAATALSKLLGQKVNMQTPSVKIVDFEEVVDMVGGSEQTVVSVFLRVKGEAPGNMFFILSPTEAEWLVRKVTGHSAFVLGDVVNQEFYLSSLQEAGNILSGSYLAALSDFTQINMQPSVPSVAIDMAGAVLSHGLMMLSTESDYALIIETVIQDQQNNEHNINSYLFLLPDPESFQKIFASLGMGGK